MKKKSTVEREEEEWYVEEMRLVSDKLKKQLIMLDFNFYFSWKT